MINSSNGTSHIFNLRVPSKLNETPILKGVQEDIYHSKVHMLQPKNRFKYKSLIQQGEMRVVSLVAKLNSFQNEGSLGNYRVLAYTSKNEFYVIDLLNSLKK